MSRIIRHGGASSRVSSYAGVARQSRGPRSTTGCHRRQGTQLRLWPESGSSVWEAIRLDCRFFEGVAGTKESRTRIGGITKQWTYWKLFSDSCCSSQLHCPFEHIYFHKLIWKRLRVEGYNAKPHQPHLLQTIYLSLWCAGACSPSSTLSCSCSWAIFERVGYLIVTTSNWSEILYHYALMFMSRLTGHHELNLFEYHNGRTYASPRHEFLNFWAASAILQDYQPISPRYLFEEWT